VSTIKKTQALVRLVPFETRKGTSQEVRIRKKYKPDVRGVSFLWCVGGCGIKRYKLKVIIQV
jgi:hypothetical protein